MLDFIEVNTSVLPEQILPYQVMVKLETDIKSFEDRLSNKSGFVSFYYFRKGPLNRYFSKFKYSFRLVTQREIVHAEIGKVFDYLALLKGRPFGFNEAADAQTFSSEIKNFLNKHIQNEYDLFTKLIQESAIN